MVVVRKMLVKFWMKERKSRDKIFTGKKGKGKWKEN